MDEKHPKSFPGKDTSFTVKKYQQIFIDFTHKKIGENLLLLLLLLIYFKLTKP